MFSCWKENIKIIRFWLYKDILKLDGNLLGDNKECKKTMRMGNDLEKKVMEWFKACRNLNCAMTGPAIQITANAIAKREGIYFWGGFQTCIL